MWRSRSHSCVSPASASVIHAPLGRLSPAWAAHLTRYAFTHRPCFLKHATGRGAEGGTPALPVLSAALPPSGVADLHRCEAAAATESNVFYRDLWESWHVISPSRFMRDWEPLRRSL